MIEISLVVLLITVMALCLLSMVMGFLLSAILLSKHIGSDHQWLK